MTGEPPAFQLGNSWLGPTSVYSGNGPDNQLSVEIGDIKISLSSRYVDDLDEHLRKVLVTLLPLIHNQMKLGQEQSISMSRFWENKK